MTKNGKWCIDSTIPETNDHGIFYFNTSHFTNSTDIVAVDCKTMNGRLPKKQLDQSLGCNSYDIHTYCGPYGNPSGYSSEAIREFSDKIYEPKILYKTKTFEDRCRMFCFNKGGLVSAENNHGIITANGHSYAEDEKRTDNCNFAILSSIRFTEPFNQPTEYAESISRLANMIGKGSVIVQRFGDLIRGQRSTVSRIEEAFITPTLKATPGDLSLVLPKRILDGIIEMIYALDKIAPGTANDDTFDFAYFTPCE